MVTSCSAKCLFRSVVESIQRPFRLKGTLIALDEDSGSRLYRSHGSRFVSPSEPHSLRSDFELLRCPLHIPTSCVEALVPHERRKRYEVVLVRFEELPPEAVA